MTREEVLFLLKECNFDGILSETNYVQKIMNFLPKNVTHFHGATKCVLIFPDCDFVIKIPFTGESRCYRETDDEGNVTYNYDGGFCAFEGAWLGAGHDDPEDEYPVSWDYCRAEVEVFKEAVYAGVEEFFLEVKEFAIINEHPIYEQKKAMLIEDIDSYEKDYDKDTRDSTVKTCNDADVYCFNDCWVSDAFAFYNNTDKVLDFLNFCRDYVDDLHRGNIGYTIDLQQPVIVDYGSFND
jgi:hypothetical protein